MRFPLLLLLTSWAALSGMAGSENAVITKTVLFTAGDQGYASYRIPALVLTPQHTVLAAAEARKHDRRDWGLIDIFFRRSVDEGRTWESSRKLVGQSDLPADLKRNPSNLRASGDAGGFTLNNPLWITEKGSGKTFLLFCAEYMRCFIMESSDGGLTFTRPRDISAAFEGFRQRDGYDWKVLAVGPGHGIQLTSGRLVAPVWLSTSQGENAHRPSVCATIYSDDAGLTWQAGEIAAGLGDDVVNPSETAVVEIETEKVMLNIRNESLGNQRAITLSANGTSAWSKPVFNQSLWEPVCMAAIISLPGGVLVFSNPASSGSSPTKPGAVSHPRQNLALRVSQDQGETWSEPLVLESGPSAYSDLALAADGTVLCFYEHGSKNPYESMSVARIPAASLRANRENNTVHSRTSSMDSRTLAHLEAGLAN